jgi:hypothetical protein
MKSSNKIDLGYVLISKGNAATEKYQVTIEDCFSYVGHFADRTALTVDIGVRAYLRKLMNNK